VIPLTVLSNDDDSRVGRDRLELLITLIDAPGFDPLFRADIIELPGRHPAYGWQCAVNGCARVLILANDLCRTHLDEWKQAKKAGVRRGEFLQNAQPLAPNTGFVVQLCRVCPARPAHTRELGLCYQHHSRWRHQRDAAPGSHAGFEQWLADQEPLESLGDCRVTVCPYLASSVLGLCEQHKERYKKLAPSNDFVRWCRTAEPIYRAGVVNLLGLPALVKAELQWGLYAHAATANRSIWDFSGIQRLVNLCRSNRLASLFEVDANGYEALRLSNHASQVRMICREISGRLRCIYYSPADTKDAGFIEPDHFGRRFTDAQCGWDLTAVSQQWLRDLLWDYMANLMRDPKCPRSRGPFDDVRRAAVELSGFLDLDAPDRGNTPHLLDAQHAQRFVADQRRRALDTLPSLGVVRTDGKPSVVTESSQRRVFNGLRKLLRPTLMSDVAAQIGLSNAFIAAFPFGGPNRRPSRNPFTDDAARALADSTNLARFAHIWDPNDRGLRDAWEAIVYTGRRCNEVLKLRLDCLGRYLDFPMLWHDQTKVGNYNEGIRIPEPLYKRLSERRRKTLDRFEDRHGRQPTPQERASIALFPSHIRNPREDQAISYGHFYRCFKEWVDTLDFGTAVPHQARHSLATSLLRAGAGLTHIRRYLGQVSDRMAEHYTKIAHSDLEDVLHAVWVAGPGAPNPGELISGDSAPLTREQAVALALDVSRRSTPADGGFCTFQPVVRGGACPWNLDCENCDKFVLSGADLLYWRRKQEQWRSIAERAPDDATAEYLHQVFAPTARAIEGLEKALAGLGLLDEALAMDLRRPQDYFHRIWSTNFRAVDLANVTTDEPESTKEPSA
jgi:integrase